MRKYENCANGQTLDLMQRNYAANTPRRVWKGGIWEKLISGQTIPHVLADWVGANWKEMVVEIARLSITGSLKEGGPQRETKPVPGHCEVRPPSLSRHYKSNRTKYRSNSGFYTTH